MIDAYNDCTILHTVTEYVILCIIHVIHSVLNTDDLICNK